MEIMEYSLQISTIEGANSIATVPRPLDEKRAKRSRTRVR